ncbi:hypothetical protein J6590_050339 [Homalodisca vitripennis]|nr:hypothetical protein J6590_050339 [Homalodisca vitripennis]
MYKLKTAVDMNNISPHVYKSYFVQQLKMLRDHSETIQLPKFLFIQHLLGSTYNLKTALDMNNISPHVYKSYFVRQLTKLRDHSETVQLPSSCSFSTFWGLTKFRDHSETVQLPKFLFIQHLLGSTYNLKTALDMNNISPHMCTKVILCNS